MAAQENAHGVLDRGRKVTTDRETEPARAHGINDAVGRSSPTPSFDVDGLIRAGLTLIPLHRWDARDEKGRQRGKSPRDGAWQARDYDSREVVEQARRDGRNVGVRLPPTWMVLDVDPRNFGGKDDPDNAAGRDPLAELVRDARIDLSACPHVVTGSGGHHYYFRKPADVQLLDSLETYPGVEFKSQGRQVVAPGSVHPNGRRYEWDDLAPFPEEAPQVPDALLRLTRRPVRAHGEAAGLGELTPEMLAASLEHLDPCDFQDHDSQWLPLMMACHHATAGEGRQEFIDWSTQDPKYRDDAWTIGRKWDSLHASPTGGRRGRPVTVKFLHKVVQEAGGQVARPEAEDDFDAWEDPEDLGRGVDDAALREPPRAEGIAAVIEEMNARHYVALDNGFQVVTEEPDPIFDGRVRYQRLSKSDFRSAYENQLVEHNDKLMSRADLWLRSPHRRTYKGIIFDPAREQEHEGWLNMWKGWSVEPRPGDWSLLRELIRDVLTDGDAASFEYVLNWMAFMFQHPEKVAEVAIAFKGAKGTGKGTLGRALFKLSGASGLHISSPGHLVGRFNSHLQNCVCLFADEAFWAGDKAGEAVLKQLVTEPTLTYEGKGRDAVTGRNHVHIVMASNNEWVVPAGMDGERRFAVFNVNERRRGDREFFNALNRQLDGGGLAGLLHEMLTRDLGDWHPRDSVPQTEALAEQKLMSQSAEESWWDGLLEAGRLPNFLCDLPWDSEAVEVDKDELHADYVAHARMLGVRPKTKAGLGMVIKKKAGFGDRQVVTHDCRKTWRWVLPKLADARAIWARRVGRG
ncbi:bifunctional DNA primase/polymerase [Xanthomonas citri]|uniref:bifunctional DNA primase/polymerase n=1 Tax=Xanthomonas citri TaxID=346 RepID=UPI002ABE11A7|nr:bifunctional DNA primase/polymerase [Xanthomonas citri]